MRNSFKITHKLLAVICSVVIVLSAISSITVNIFAVEDVGNGTIDVWDGTIATGYADGTGTVGDPYLISTPEELALMVTTSGGDTLGRYYKLTADMYLNDTTNPDWKNNNPKNWCAPEKDNFFRGNFDGNGHTVRGLYYNGSKKDVALFAGIRGTSVSIKNLAIADSSLTTTENYAAAFAGQVYNSSISVFQNCYVADTVTVTSKNYSAGFIGGGTCASILFENCASFASITTTTSSSNRYGSFVGGLTYNSGTGDARKITYENCMGNIVYTNYAQYPTYTASYCAVDGTAHSGSNKTYPTVVSLGNMKGTAAKTNMPNLDWDVYKTTGKYPVLNFMEVTDSEDSDENQGGSGDNEGGDTGDGDQDNSGEENLEDVLYSFENWSAATYDKSQTGISFADVSKDGTKSLKYSLPQGTGNFTVPRVALLNEGSKIAKIVAGTAYELNFWYKVDGTPTNRGQFVVYTTTTGGATGDSTRKLQVLDKNVIFYTDTTDSGENGWVKATVKFVADLKDKNHNLVAIGVKGIGSAAVDKDIYIDAVTVKKYVPSEEEDAVYSFETWSGGTYDKSQTGISFADVAKDGLSSFKYRLPEQQGNYTVPRVALLSEGWSTAKVVAGTAYELNFWYKVDGTPTNNGQFVVYTAKAGGATGDETRKLQVLDKNLIFDTDTTDSGENGWVKATVRFIADLKDEEHNLVVIGVKGIGDAPVDKDIYIDAVTIEEYVPSDDEDVVYSFENWSGGTYDKSLSGISFADVAKDGKKSLKYRLPEGTANYGTPRVAVLTDGWSTAKVEEGSLYELSFWYKVDGTPNHKGQFMVYTTKIGGTTDTANRQSQILDKKVIFDSDTTGSGENGWVKATVKFIADIKGDEYNLVSIGVMGIGEASVDKDIYIDAVTLQKVELDGEEDIVYSFENWSAGTHDKSQSGISFADVSKDGAKSLKYRLDAGTGNYAIPRVALLNEGLNTAKAVLGTTYEMSFWYKVDGTPTNKGEFVVYTANSGGATSDAYRQVQTLDKKVIFDTDTTDSGENGWVKETVTFTADINEDGRDLIVIGIKGIGNAPVDKDIYIDAVTIKTLHVAKICKITAHYNDADNTVKVINAVVGKPISIPPVDRPGYYIQSWYTDEDLTNKFDPSKISEGKMDIYAKWAVMDGEVVCDFDSYPFIPGKGMNAACYTIANNVGVDNTKALKYATSALYTNWWNTRLAGIAIGGSSYYLNEKSLYKVSFKYFVPSKPDATINVNIWAANRENIGDTTNALQQNVSETLIINDETPTGKWLTYTASFTAELYNTTIDSSTANDTLTGLNLLALGVVTGEKLSTNSIVYFDNFTVENIKAEAQTTITAHTKGSSETQVFNGVPGHTLVEPPIRKDYIFDGWYSDSDLTKPVKAVKFPESGNLDVYVKWKSFKNGDSITIGFDDYTYVSGSKQFYPWYSMDNTDSADGDGVSVKATMDSSCSTTMRLAYKGYPVLIEDGSRYLVSFSYKNIDEIPNKWTVRVYANSPLNCGIGTTQQSSEDDAYRLTLSRAAGFGIWKRHTYSFTASLKYPGHNALAINMQTNSFSEVKEIRARIDNVTIKRIADDDIVCMTNTLAGPDYVVGKKGEKIVLPNDLKLDGYKFLGWYMDKNYGLEVADALFSEDTVFYAKWARVKITQDFEEYDYPGYGIGYDLDIECYNDKVSGYDSKNVYSGNSSIHRIGKVSSDKKFTLITDANDKISIGETYKVTYYVKLISTKNEDQSIYVLPTDSYFYPGACDTDMAIPSVSLSDLYPGIWYKITNIVTLYSPYLAVKTPGLSDIYFDDFTIELVNSDTIIDESEKVVPLGKVPAKIDENDEFEDTEFEDTLVDIPIVEDGSVEDIVEDIVDENVEGNNEKAPQKNEVSNNASNEKPSNNTVVILVISILAAVLVVVAIFVAIYLKTRKVK